MKILTFLLLPWLLALSTCIAQDADASRDGGDAEASGLQRLDKQIADRTIEQVSPKITVQAGGVLLKRPPESVLESEPEPIIGISENVLRQDQDFKEYSARGQAWIEAGSIDQGGTFYEAAIEEVDTPQLKAAINVEWANALSRAARSAPNQAEIQALAAQRYREALPLVSGDARLLTFNNYGSLLLRQDQPKQALEVLQAVEADFSFESDAAKRARYLFNLGRAFEQNNDLAQAADRYHQAAADAPDFSPASLALLRVLPELPPTDNNQHVARDWLKTLIRHPDIKLLEQGLFTVLTAWRNEASPDWLLDILVRYLSLAQIGPADFSHDWHPLLPLGTSTDELVSVYRDRLPIDFFDPGLGAELFPHLVQVSGTQAISAFLVTVGDAYKVQNEHQRALERYALAWGLDNTNGQSALSTANLLLNYPEGIENAESLIEQFIDALFSGKGEAYLGGKLETILRFHTILGTIFVQRQQWGTPGDPYGALFQFANAVKIHAQLVSSKGPDAAGPIAGVKAELARVYAHAGDPERAAVTYIEAAVTALEEDDHELARHILKELHQPKYWQRLTPDQQKRALEARQALDGA